MSARAVAVAAALAAAGLAGAGCGDDGSGPRPLSAGDQATVERALYARQPVLPRGCFNVTRPLTARTIRSYVTLRRIAREHPDGLYQSPDFQDLRTPVRDLLAETVRILGECLATAPRRGPGWHALHGELKRSQAALPPP